MARPEDGGTYHLAAGGYTTWFLYANQVFDQYRSAQAAPELVVKEVAPVTSDAFPTPARRPHNSRLDTTRLQAVFGLTLPPWQQGVDRMLKEIL